MFRRRWPSPPIRSRTSRYSSADRVRLSASSTSASMTLIGVRSSWEASAVNSTWRRWISSSGAEARSPMIRDPMKVATSRRIPKRSSGAMRALCTRSSWARLSPATSHPSPERTAWKRKSVPLMATVVAPALQVRSGSFGAPEVRAVGRPVALTIQTNRGASSMSWSVSVGACVDVAGEDGVVCLGQALGQADVGLAGQTVDHHQVEGDHAEDVANHDHRGGHDGHPGGMEAPAPACR